MGEKYVDMHLPKKIKRRVWYWKYHQLQSHNLALQWPAFSLDLSAKRAMILVLLPCTVHCCFQPLILCSWAMKLCSGLKCSTEKVLSPCSMVQDVPRGCPVNSSALLAAASRQSCSAIPTTLTLPASACRISTAVLLHPWQWCKVAVTAVFKHCSCKQLCSMKSLKGTHRAGAEKLVFSFLKKAPHY